MGKETLDVVVETPTGSRNKYEIDHGLGLIRLDRRIPSATIYPADYGYVPEALGLDGDELDALVLVEDPTFPGCVVRSKVLGVFKMRDENGPDAKLITVPTHELRWAEASDIGDVPESLRDEIEHFFDVYKDLEPGSSTETQGFGERTEALEELRAARERFAEAR